MADQDQHVLADIKQSQEDFTDAKHLFKKVDSNILNIDQYGNVQEKFYEATQVSMFIDSARVTDMTSITFQAVTEDGPAYSYNSKLFNTLIPGKFKVIGTFSVNFTKAGHIFKLLAESDDTMKRDVTAIKDRQRAVDKFAQGGTTPEAKVAKEREDFRKAYWGTNSTDKENERLLDIDINAQRRRTFTISLLYGNQNDPLQRYTLHRISHAKIVKVEQSIAQDGNPIQEIYTFIARTFDDPTEIREKVELRPAVPEFTEAKKKEVLIKFLRQIGRNLYTYLTDPDSIEMKVESVLSDHYIKDMPVLKINRLTWNENDKIVTDEDDQNIFWQGMIRKLVNNNLRVETWAQDHMTEPLSSLPTSIISSELTTVSGFYFRIKPSLAKQGTYGAVFAANQNQTNDLNLRKTVIGHSVLEAKYKENAYDDDVLSRAFAELAWSVILDPSPVSQNQLSCNTDPYVVFDTASIANGTKILGAFKTEFEFDGINETSGFLYVDLYFSGKWSKVEHPVAKILGSASQNQRQFSEDAFSKPPLFTPVVVKSEDGTVTYVEKTDYEIMYGLLGLSIKILSDGAIKNQEDNLINTKVSRFRTWKEYSKDSVFKTSDGTMYIYKGTDVTSFESEDEVALLSEGIDPIIEKIKPARIRLEFNISDFYEETPVEESTPERVYDSKYYPGSFIPFSLDTTFHIKGKTAEERKVGLDKAVEQLRKNRSIMTDLALSNSRMLSVDFNRNNSQHRRDVFNTVVEKDSTQPHPTRTSRISGKHSVGSTQHVVKANETNTPIDRANTATGLTEQEVQSDIIPKQKPNRRYSNLIFLPLDDDSRRVFKEERTQYTAGSVPSIIRSIDELADGNPDIRILQKDKNDLCWIDISGDSLFECFKSGDLLYLSMLISADNARVTVSKSVKIENLVGTNLIRDAIERGETNIFPMLTPSKLMGGVQVIDDEEPMIVFETFKDSLQSVDTFRLGVEYEAGTILKYQEGFVRILATHTFTNTSLPQRLLMLPYIVGESDLELLKNEEETAVIRKKHIKSVKYDSITTEDGYLKIQMAISIYENKISDINLSGPATPDSKIIARIGVRAIPELSLLGDLDSDRGKDLQFYNDFNGGSDLAKLQREEADQSTYYFISSTSKKQSAIVDGVTIDTIVPRIMTYITSSGFIFDYKSYIKAISERLAPIYTVGHDGIDVDYKEILDAISDGFIIQRQQYGVSSNRSAQRNILQDHDGCIISKVFMNEPLSQFIAQQLDISKTVKEVSNNANSKSDNPVDVLNTENFLTLLKAPNSFEATAIANIVYKYHHEYIPHNIFRKQVKEKYNNGSFEIPEHVAVIKVDNVFKIQANENGDSIPSFTNNLFIGAKIKLTEKELVVTNIESNNIATVTGSDDADITPVGVFLPVTVLSVPAVAMSNMLLVDHATVPTLDLFEFSENINGAKDIRWKSAIEPKRNILPHSEFTFLEKGGRLMDIVSTFTQNPGDPILQTQLISLVEKDSAENKQTTYKDISASKNSLDFTFEFFSNATRPAIGRPNLIISTPN